MTSCFYLSVAANPFCQQGFIRNKPACDTLGPSASLNKSPMHGVVQRVHRLQKGPQRQSLSSLMGSERLCFHMEDAHQMRGRERQHAVRKVQAYVSHFECISRTEHSCYLYSWTPLLSGWIIGHVFIAVMLESWPRRCLLHTQQFQTAFF